MNNVQLTPEEIELVIETCFQKADRLDDTFEKSNARTKFRIKEKADSLRTIVTKLRQSK